MKSEQENLQQELDAYTDEWAKMMVTIWKDRINRLGVINTRTLLNSVLNAGRTNEGKTTVITHRFVQYGIYQDRGTGNGYVRGNNGKLEALDRKSKKYRRDRKHREARPWFSRARYSSVLNLRDTMARMMGEAFIGLFDDWK